MSKSGSPITPIVPSSNRYEPSGESYPFNTMSADSFYACNTTPANNQTTASEDRDCTEAAPSATPSNDGTGVGGAGRKP